MTGSGPYDVIVVGGGPAGAAAILHARRLSLRVLLLDKARFPRDKTCGDALSGRSVTELRTLGLLDEVRALPGATIRRVVFGGPSGQTASIPPLPSDQPASSASPGPMAIEGYVVPRLHLDALLFDRARAAADHCLEGFAVRDLVREDGRVVGVTGQAAGGTASEFRGRVVLGCDGFGSVVARRTGLYRHQPEHSMVAIRCYHEGVAGLDDQIELHFLDEVLPGYFWIFPAGQGRANVGIGMNHADLTRRGIDLRQALARVLDSPRFRDRFRAARPLEKPTGWNLPVGSTRRPVCGEGFLLLGDAAGLIDPFTGEGIGNALCSARLAVETAAEACAAGDFSARFLRRYENRLWEALGRELATSTRLHGLARRRWLVDFVIRKAARRPEVSAAIAAMMLNADDRRQLLGPRFYLGLLR
ncbi:MAG: NAD(P)/FAD-dependent oxidoreductase [Candidatus Latescibacterota bacterium]|jgi:geranylgeranyl reductase family protein